MEMKDVIRREFKTKQISIRTYPAYSKWMSENNISPTALFNSAVKELMEKHGSDEPINEEVDSNED